MITRALDADAHASRHAVVTYKITQLTPRMVAGFGLTSVFPSFLMPPIAGGALVGLLFPLFVIQAIGANPKRAQAQGGLFGSR